MPGKESQKVAGPLLYHTMGSPRCDGCAVPQCRVEAASDDRLLSGWRLAVTSMGLFLGPIVLTLVGATCFPSKAECQLAGAMIGLAAGIGSSIAVVKLMRRFEMEIP